MNVLMSFRAFSDNELKIRSVQWGRVEGISFYFPWLVFPFQFVENHIKKLVQPAGLRGQQYAEQKTANHVPYINFLCPKVFGIGIKRISAKYH